MEKLRVAECVGYTHIETEGGRGVAYDMLAEDARRVVACVNALQGVPTELLENMVRMGITDVTRGNLFSSRVKLQAQRDQLQEVCAEAYQFAGAYDAPVEVLDNLYAAANGLPLPHKSFLPVDDSELVKQRDQLLEALEYIGRFIEPTEIDGEAMVRRAKAAIAAVKGNDK